jgi:hypothetical protein
MTAEEAGASSSVVGSSQLMVSEFDVFCEDVETNDTKNERYLNGA